jgi:hypothetical protein
MEDVRAAVEVARAQCRTTLNRKWIAATAKGLESLPVVTLSPSIPKNTFVLSMNIGLPHFLMKTQLNCE